jgi:FkbM family methyltransferase
MSLKEIRNEFKQGHLPKHDYIKKVHGVHSQLFEYADVLPQTDVKKIEITPEGVAFTIKHRALKDSTPPAKFFVNSMDQRVTPIETFNFDTYEFDDFKMILKLIKDGQVILDIGGNIGFHAVSLGSEFPNAKVYSFEPIPKTFAYLKKHVEANGLKNVQVFNHGFSDSEKDLVFYFYPEGSGNASSANLSERTDAEKITCHVSVVDKFVKEKNLKVDFIKCDVEGAEFFVFKGAEQVLKEQRPIVFAEILRKWSRKFGYEPNEIFDFFSGLNYQAYVVRGSELVKFGKMTEDTMETNFFFLPKEK